MTESTVDGTAAAAGVLGGVGTLFLLVAAAALVLGVLVHRHRTLHRVDTPASLPGTAALALLGGGPTRVVAAGLARLRVDGLVGPAGPDGRVTVGAHATAGLPAVERALHAALAAGTPLPAVAADPGVADALTRLRTEVVRQGLLLDGATRARLRIGPLLLLLTGVVGLLASIVSAVRGDFALGPLLVGVASGFVGLVLLVTTPRVTPAGLALLARARQASDHLRPVHRPAFATYGGLAAGTAVGLFGLGSLREIDPTFTAARRSGDSTYYGGSAVGCGSGGNSDSGDSGGGSSGGGSCGGGSGCGGSSGGGGSSCGGGGGCGGGGS